MEKIIQKKLPRYISQLCWWSNEYYDFGCDRYCILSFSVGVFGWRWSKLRIL